MYARARAREVGRPFALPAVAVISREGIAGISLLTPSGQLARQYRIARRASTYGAFSMAESLNNDDALAWPLARNETCIIAASEYLLFA